MLTACFAKALKKNKNRTQEHTDTPHKHTGADNMTSREAARETRNCLVSGSDPVVGEAVS